MLRFDYAKEDQAEAFGGGKALPGEITATISKTMAALYPDFDHWAVDEMLTMLWRNNGVCSGLASQNGWQDSIPLLEHKASDGVYLDMEPLKGQEESTG